MDASFRDWAWLPPLSVNMMVAKLDQFFDYVSFSGVCPQWRYVAFETSADRKVNLDLCKASRGKLPMLMFKTDENNDERRSLYSVSDGKTYTVKLPLPYKKRFVGSSLGWLFCVSFDTMVVTLVNPYKNCCISLPVFEMVVAYDRKWSDYYITKGILSSDPHSSENGFEVVAIYGGEGEIAFFKSGMSSWSFMPYSPLLVDIVCYKGKVYGVTMYAMLVGIDLHSGIVETIIPSGNKIYEQTYLVESQYAELLMITRKWNEDSDDENVYAYNEDYDLDENISLDTEDYDSDRDALHVNTRVFKVFKMTHPIKKGLATWVEVNNIGQQALFLGENHSVCVSTTEFPECQPNSIYYTSHHHVKCPTYKYNERGEDTGIFNLEDGSFSKHHVLDSSYKYMQPSIWFLPTP